MGSPIIWFGNALKALKNKLFFNNNISIESGTLDPTVTPVDGEPGSQYNSSNGNIYIKQDSGSTTNWSILDITDNEIPSGGNQYQFLGKNSNSNYDVTWFQNPAFIQFFGDGSDGNVVISSGATTLTRDMYYNNLTINGTGGIIVNGYRIFVKEILDLSAAPTISIRRLASAGGNATGATAGSGGGAGATGSLLSGSLGANGGSGNTGAGTVGVSAISASTNNGGGGAGGGSDGGQGGAPALAAGANAGATTTTNTQNSFLKPEINFFRGTNAITGGSGGAGGGGGTGDGVNAGGGGGGGGAGGSVLTIYARTINKSSITANRAISSYGRDGGNGGNGVGGNAGGGGGGAGGGGGWIYICYAELIGSTTTLGVIDASGGNGGIGGNGVGTGRGGRGGHGGYGGRITLVNLLTGTVSETNNTTIIGSSATLPTTSSGTTGGVGTLTVVDF